MKKRVISSLLVFCMVLGLFAGCGKKEEKKANNGERVTLTVGIPQNGMVTDYEENAFTQYIEENVNVDLEIVLLPASVDAFEQQLTLMSVSNETLPDVILGYAGMTKGTVYNFGRNGVLQDLTDLLDEYGVNFKEQRAGLSKELQEKIDLCMKDPETGKIFGMPWFAEFITIDDCSPCTININKDWLNKVGMSVPTNIDELYKVLKAFKENDLNGNGKADEIPMLGQGIIAYIINAFTYYDGSNYVLKEGKVYNPNLTDEYRQALQTINKWKEEGLLSELNFTSTSKSEFVSLISPTDNVAKVGVWCGHPELVTTSNTTILNQYTSMGELADATGEGGYMVVNGNQFYFTGLVTRDCDEPEAAMQFLDFLYTDGVITRARWGAKDVNWKEGSGTNMLGNPSTIQPISSAATNNTTWVTTLVGIITEENYLAIMDFTDDPQGHKNRLCTEGAKLVQEANRKKEVLTDIVYNQKEREEKASVEGDVSSYMQEMQSKFAMGTVDIDSDKEWNAYKAEMERLGSSELVKVVQEAYERVYK